MSRRTAGEGCVREREDGRWSATVSLGFGTDGKRVRKTFYGATAEEVGAKLLEARSKAARGVPIRANERGTVAKYLARWLETRKASIRPASYASYESIVRVHVIPAIGSRQLARLTPQHVSAVTAALAAKRSGTTARGVRKVVSAALRDAMEEGLIARNVAAISKAPHAEPKPIEALTPAEARTLLDHVAGDPLRRALWMTLLLTGLRRGEALGLAWSGCDLVAGTASITRTLIAVRGRAIEGEPKTRAGRRTIPLPASLVDLLRGVQAAQFRAHASRWVFADPTTGGQLHPHTVSDWWVADVKAAGLPHRKLHSTRHTFASWAAAGGTSVRDVADMLGHADPGVTLKMYQRSFESTKRDASDRVASRLLGEVATS